MTNAPRVVIAEDESIVALDIRNRLSRMGYAILAVVDSGEAAIALTVAARPDIVLMDIRLKGEIDGIEAARRIRQKLSVPIIYLTASADLHTSRRAERDAPAPFLLKPFDIQELRDVIEDALAGSLRGRTPRES
ncbi:MAG: response regulator [Anaerolineae bacterium]|nr:response regulator [Anaerolineae bacterium]